MNTYTKVWQSVAATTTTVGVGAALLTLTASAVVFLVVLGATLAGLATAGFYTRDGVAPPPRPVWVMASLTHAVFGAAVAVAAAGIGAVSPGLLVCLLGVLAATSPTVVGFSRRHIPPPHHSSDGEPSEAVVDDPITPIGPATAPRPATASMSDHELCPAWRASFTALQAATTSAATARIAAQRQSYLDEFERRNPRGLRAWLGSGARAAGNPHRYLLTDHLPTDFTDPDQAGRRDDLPPAA